MLRLSRLLLLRIAILEFLCVTAPHQKVERLDFVVKLALFEASQGHRQKDQKYRFLANQERSVPKGYS